MPQTKGQAEPYIIPERIYIPLEEDEQFKWEWTKDEIDKLKLLYQQGLSPYEIAEQLNRDPDEVGVCIIGLAREGKLE